MTCIILPLSAPVRVVVSDLSLYVEYCAPPLSYFSLTSRFLGEIRQTYHVNVLLFILFDWCTMGKVAQDGHVRTLFFVMRPISSKSVRE